MHAITAHNKDRTTGKPRYGLGSVAPNLPTALELSKKLYTKLVQDDLKEVLPVLLNVSQERVCMWHGCLQATSDHLVSISLVDATSARSFVRGGKTYVYVIPEDVAASYKDRGQTSTLHFLWRLQAAKQKEQLGKEQYDAIAFDLYTFGEKAMRVTIQTRQEYEDVWIYSTWVFFVLRFIIYCMVDVVAQSCRIQCANTHGEAGVMFLECVPSRRLYVLLFVLVLLDFANILNPIYNITSVQQGEFLWSGQNDHIVDMLGYSACKVELALVPATITVLGRMLTGNYHIGFEAFLFQMGVFIMPLITAKLGYSFVLNTSTICLSLMLASIAVRFALRLRENPLAGTIMCSDDTFAALDRKPNADNISLYIALGSWDPTIVVNAELDTSSAFRSFFLGLQTTSHSVPTVVVTLEEHVPTNDAAMAAAIEAANKAAAEDDIIDKFFDRSAI
jgi:hypothetical protein